MGLEQAELVVLGAAASLADGAQAWSCVPVLQAAFELAVARPDAGNFKLNAVPADHFHQARTLPGAMLGDAREQVRRVSEIIGCMAERAFKMQ
jgi:hypothetical protein